jgi:hypothetical protein
MAEENIQKVIEGLIPNSSEYWKALYSHTWMQLIHCQCIIELLKEGASFEEKPVQYLLENAGSLDDHGIDGRGITHLTMHRDGNRDSAMRMIEHGRQFYQTDAE